jgi:hypothetical protein
MSDRDEVRMNDIASFHIYDTTLQISTLKNPPPQDKRVANWGHGFQPPDWETFNRLRDVLADRGFEITSSPKHDKHYPTLAKFHRIASIMTPHGKLSAACEAGTNSCSIEFYQDVVYVNRNGGRFDFDKLQKMPYLIRKKYEGAMAALTTHLTSRGFVEITKIETPIIDLPIGQRLSACDGTAVLPGPAEIAEAAKTFFNDKWDTPYDKKRGTHRFSRDETGWPTAYEVTESGRRDRDLAYMSHGDVRLFRDMNGHLARGRVFGGIGSMWIVVFGPGPRDYTHLSSKELFSGDPRTLPRRQKKAKSLAFVLEEAIKRQDFERAIVLRDLIARTTATKQAA